MTALLVMSLAVWAAEPAWTLRDGDRVVLVGSTLLEREQNEGYLETVLVSRFPGRKLVFRNLAWSGDTVDVQTRPLNFGSLEEHVAAARPTWIVAAFGTNELLDPATTVDAFAERYTALLDRLAETGAKPILLTPAPLENPGPPLPDLTLHNDRLDAFADTIKQVAVSRSARVVDLLAGDRHDASGRLGQWTENGLHLSPAGYRWMALVAEQQLGLRPRRWTVVVDANDAVVESLGTRAEVVSASADNIQLRLRDNWLPVSPPVDTEHDEPALAIPRSLAVRGLAPGTYELQIDGDPICRATHKQWAAGMVITTGPEFAQVEQLQKTIVDKNFWFFHRWRAHNGEYIYGRRSATKSTGDGQGNSGNPQFPEEFAELERLVATEEARIAALSVPVAHRYELKRVESP